MVELWLVMTRDVDHLHVVEGEPSKESEAHHAQLAVA